MHMLLPKWRCEEWARESTRILISRIHPNTQDDWLFVTEDALMSLPDSKHQIHVNTVVDKYVFLSVADKPVFQ